MEDKHCPRNYTCTSRHGKKGACCPSRDFVCGTPFEVRSSCRKPKTEASWSFNYRKGECERVEHPACDEHWNSFPNHEQCVEYCVGTCPDYKEVHMNPLTGQPQLCDTKKRTGCPLGYECFKSSPFASICCKTSPVCPSAESIAYVKDEQLIRCNPTHHDSCPEDYSCQEAKNLEYICCTKPLSCPTGMIALREDGGKPRVCSVGVEGTCPTDHMCVLAEGQTIFGSARHMCCKPEKKCIVPYVDAETKRPQRCFPGSTIRSEED
ncbi:hypothetical protein WR25_05270 [Diploscapter pachys]|uniref:BPTI/Kunitz inhibitor domain-containing protein n=1 Tax=Diploscapter pachys TaxID=2018661 RepID=A0A2A2LSA2_9BILA|nr:hypothetical protein WR25_05270 [Diploscapter pachys]